MMYLVDCWYQQKDLYIQRYLEFYVKYRKNPEDKNNLGHLHECSYVLITFFGLKPKDIVKLENSI